MKLEMIGGHIMDYDFGKASTIPSVFNDETRELQVPPDTVIEEIAIRRMKDMRELFRNSVDYEDDYPLYYMYNGIYRSAHKEIFKSQRIRYEYTILMPQTIHKEMMKAHGHIHGVHPIKKTRHIEAYEVLQGTGFFELFAYEENSIQVIMLNVKPGDYLIIPSGYYHLSINTGKDPFIFGDLIIEDANSEYGHLKEMKGAPVFVMEGSSGSPEFVLNKQYHEHEIRITQLNAEEVPWENPVDPIPLYAHFIADPDAFSFLK